MHLKLYLGQCVIFCCNYYLISVNALAGKNIRHPNPNEYLFVVSIVRVNLQDDTIAKKLCIGTLVSLKDVLTAQHCILGEHVTHTEVVAGSIDFRLGTRYSLIWWISYDSWFTKFEPILAYEFNDLCMIRLLISVSDNIIPIPLAQESNQHYYGSRATIATWSTTNASSFPTIMDLGDVKILTDKQCSKGCKSFYTENKNNFWRYMCSTAKPTVAIEIGDSGGPLIYQGILIAINNGFCPTTKDPAKIVNIHTGIEYYKRFIYSSMEMI